MATEHRTPDCTTIQPVDACGGCKYRTRNGMSNTREYRIWVRMLDRCYRPANPNFPWYGGLGHYVCKRWRESGLAFIEDMGKAPSAKHTLDRVNTLGHYTCGKCDECRENNQPANCRWATKEQQVRNAKNNLWYTHKGKTLILKDWARISGIKYLTLYDRIKRGWSFERAISTPKIVNQFSVGSPHQDATHSA